MYTCNSNAGVMVQRRLFSRVRIALLSTLTLVLQIAPPIPANAQATDAVISGTATDAQGAALPNVNITARNTDTGSTRTVLTGADGRYRITALPTGKYELLAQRDGFTKTQVRDIVLTVGQEFERDVVLNAGGVEQTVSVTAQQPLVNTTSNEVGSAVISQDQVENLPIPGR